MVSYMGIQCLAAFHMHVIMWSQDLYRRYHEGLIKQNFESIRERERESSALLYLYLESVRGLCWCTYKDCHPSISLMPSLFQTALTLCTWHNEHPMVLVTASKVIHQGHLSPYNMK